MQTDADTTARIVRVVATQLEVDADEISETARLVEDLDADSLSLVSVLSGLEHEFRINIDPAETSRMTDVRGIRAVIADAVAAGPGQSSTVADGPGRSNTAGW
jgi:acyl carrier protein